MQGWEFDLSIFSIFKKIDCDWIDLSVTKNDWFDPKKRILYVFDSFPPVYAKECNHSRQSSIFFKDRHDWIDHKNDRFDQKNWWSNSQPCPFVIDTNKGDSVNNFVSLPLHVLKKDVKRCCFKGLLWPCPHNTSYMLSPHPVGTNPLLHPYLLSDIYLSVRMYIIQQLYCHFLYPAVCINGSRINNTYNT